ncbi:MAG TPA: Ig-like domain-containing protein, partial [Puia sp.]|nr:Ig-like domain-containing protein [Puia sp.]
MGTIQITIISGMLALAAAGWTGCSKKGTAPDPVVTHPPQNFNVAAVTVNNKSGPSFYTVNTIPVIRFAFLVPIDTKTVNGSFSFADNTGTAVPFGFTYEKGDSTVVIQPSAALKNISAYSIGVSASLRSQSQGALLAGDTVHIITAIDSSDKYPRISDSALLDLVEQQTLQYFWSFGHPVSGLARERNSSADVVTTGGSGFGVM